MNAVAKLASSEPNSADYRAGAYDWNAIGFDLDVFGYAVLRKLLSPAECKDIVALYPQEEHFRSHVHMARYGSAKASIAISDIRSLGSSARCV
jgi:hypothetical protein